MINKKYAKAYVEILEMLRYLPEQEYNKIPKEKINFFEENKDITYNFNINPNMPLENQNISLEANSIIVTLFRDYFATAIQKEKLEKILIQNENKYEEELRKKYNPDDIFKKVEKEDKLVNKEIISNTLPVEIKEYNFFQKFILYIKNLIFKNQRK